MNRLAQSLLQSARVAELKRDADEFAGLAKPAPRVELPHDGGRRVLIALLARERRRNAKLVAELLR